MRNKGARQVRSVKKGEGMKGCQVGVGSAGSMGNNIAPHVGDKWIYAIHL